MTEPTDNPAPEPQEEQQPQAEQQPIPMDLALAQQDEQTAIHILGGFGINVHKGDMEYAQKVNERLGAMMGINAEDVECMLSLVKVRRPDNKFDLVGATFGLEPELTALHMVLGARLRQLRAIIEAQIRAQPPEAPVLEEAEGNKEEVTNG